ncbi:hypothetical protein RB597_005459 [Gaeumannomyces tritici]
MRCTDFLQWLDAIPDGPGANDIDPPPDDPPALDRKRRRVEDAQGREAATGYCGKKRKGADHRSDFRTPPLSRTVSRTSIGRKMDESQESCGEATPNAKRQNKSGGANDKTPRASLLLLQRSRQLSRDGSTASSDKMSAGSSRSRITGSYTSSARKRRREMELGPDGVNIQNFASMGHMSCMLPSGLRALLAELQTSGCAVVSSSRRREIQAATLPGIEVIRDTAFFDPPEDQGRFEAQESPSLADILRVLDKAAEYAERGWDEAGWNVAVHYPLLRLAIPDESQVDIAPCTTADIQRQFLPTSASRQTGGKRVDFCITINPHWPRARFESTPASRAIKGVCRQLPGLSINHTSYHPLADRPIAISIETKRLGGSVENAEIQLGIWQAAQWNMLEMLTRSERSGTAPPLAKEPNPSDSPSSGPELTSLNGLDFLPAIYIVGHEWKFAATTKSSTTTGDDKDGTESGTTLWTEFPIGDTTSVLGIYRIVWCLRRLARYSVEEFWLWHQKNVLQMGTDA